MAGKRRWFAALLVLVLTGITWRMSGAPRAQLQARTKVNPKDGLTYAWIPPGTFRMGCSADDSLCQPPEKPAHSVTITKGFWIGQTQVTQAAYMQVMAANPSHFRGDRLPVDGVSWNDAQAYCERVGMRLPTEAEYEYAARGGSKSAVYAPLKQIAWYNTGRNPGGGTTHEVGQKQPNGYGLYDMLGNVWEWVADWYGPYDSADAVDPKGPPTGQFHVVRGGSWDEIATVVRVSFRNKVVHGISDDYNGFRCAGN
jgi:formylglycine-generating enzyme required for sulfatase activity